MSLEYESWAHRRVARDDGGRFAGDSFVSRVARSVAATLERAEDAATQASPVVGGRFQVRPALAAARTAEQVAEAFMAEARRITGRDIRADMRGLSPATSREHAEGVLRGLERFPRVELTWVSRMTEHDSDLETYAHVQQTSTGQRMRFSPKWASAEGRKGYLRSLVSDVRAHWHPKNTDHPVAIALHEFGHVLDFSTAEEVHKRVRGIVRAEAKRMARPGADPSVLIGPAITMQVSKYAESDSTGYELIAEAFADVMVNGDEASRISRKVFAELEAAYARMFGGDS